jgi:hypothetical protein
MNKLGRITVIKFPRLKLSIEKKLINNRIPIQIKLRTYFRICYNKSDYANLLIFIVFLKIQKGIPKERKPVFGGNLCHPEPNGIQLQPLK